MKVYKHCRRTVKEADPVATLLLPEKLMGWSTSAVRKG